MIAARRLQWNFALQRAVEYACDLRLPLVVLEALDVDYPWASDRLHAFVVQGMAVNARLAARSPALYIPFVEPAPGRGRGLIAHLSARAAVIVTDDYPAFFIPRVLDAAGRQAACRVEAVDSNGLIPISAHGRAFTSARSYRAFVQRSLREHLRDVPEAAPLARLPRAARLELKALGIARWLGRTKQGRSAADVACSIGSCLAIFPATAPSTIIPTPTAPADSRRTCTSATCRPTTSSRAS
jgi:deoxyribodipyrimidine photo-lyase